MIEAKPISWNADKGLVAPGHQVAWDAPVGLYPFWEGGGDIRDLSKARVGTLVGNDDAGLPTWQTGAFGRELHNPGAGFDTQAYIDLGALPELDNVESCTILIVAKWTQSTVGYLFSGGDVAANNAIYSMDVNQPTTGDVRWSFRNDAGSVNTSIVASLSINDDEYHTIALVQRGKSFRELFVDGVSYGTNTDALGIITLNDFVLFARRRATEFDEALTADMVLCWISNVGLSTGYIKRWSEDPLGLIRMAPRTFGFVASEIDTQAKRLSMMNFVSRGHHITPVFGVE